MKLIQDNFNYQIRDGVRKQFRNKMSTQIWDNTSGVLPSEISNRMRAGITFPILRAILEQLKEEINGLNTNTKYL